jgi:hypothetical protein
MVAATSPITLTPGFAKIIVRRCSPHKKPSMSLSVHDNYLTGYEVLSERREIRLHTEPLGETTSHIDVIFSGVECYHFEHDAFGNIIFGIDEVPAAELYTQHAEALREGYRLSGWPGPWNESSESALAFLNQHSIRGFVLSSSYGMSGWVLARDMKMLSNDNHNARA